MKKILIWFRNLFKKDIEKPTFELIRTPHPDILIEFDGVEHDRYGEQYIPRLEFEEDIFIPIRKIKITKDQFKIIIKEEMEKIKNEQRQKNR